MFWSFGGCSFFSILLGCSLGIVHSPKLRIGLFCSFYPMLKSGWRLVVVDSPYGCCYVCPGLGLKCMRDLGVEETPNGLDKPSEERNLTKI